MSAGGLPPAPGAELDANIMEELLSQSSPPAAKRGRPITPSHHDGGAVHVLANTQARSRAPFDAYVVLDFEATCEANRRIPQPEVIELPLVVVDADAAQVVGEFQRYVRPVVQPTLSDFCTSLTGITQAQVDASATFPTVFNEALHFLSSCELGDAAPHRSYCIVTCGDWDLQTMLPAQLRVSGALGVPTTWQRWCNLKKYMMHATPPILPPPRPNARKAPQRIGGMPDMLAAVGLKLRGRHHSGIDDCRNIAAVLCELLKRGYVVEPTWRSIAANDVRWRSNGTMLPAWSSLASPTVPTSSWNHDAPTTAEEEANPRPYLDVDAQRNAVEELFPAGSPPTMTPGEQKTISKQLSHILRHSAEEKGLRISRNGYVRLADVLQIPPLKRMAMQHGTTASAARVAEVVAANDKQRYRMAYDRERGELYIAAVQGHSISGIDADLHRVLNAEEVPVAVHGTYWHAWKQIASSGYLSPMRREHIHFAQGLSKQDGVISGMRGTVEVLMYLDVPRVLADGIALFTSSNGVVLTPGLADTRQLPMCYISKVVNRATGQRIEVPPCVMRA